MTILKRKVQNKSGEIITYQYDTTIQQTTAKKKRDILIQFINEHKSELDKLYRTKKDKIEHIKNNIDKTYTYSNSMIYKYL